MGLEDRLGRVLNATNIVNEVLVLEQGDEQAQESGEHEIDPNLEKKLGTVKNATKALLDNPKFIKVISILKNNGTTMMKAQFIQIISNALGVGDVTKGTMKSMISKAAKVSGGNATDAA